MYLLRNVQCQFEGWKLVLTIYESSIVLNMAALRSITFEESLREALRGLNLESVSLRVNSAGN